MWAGNATFAGGKGTNRVVQPLGTRTLRKSSFDARGSPLNLFLRDNFNSGFDSSGPTTTQIVLASVLTPVLLIAALLILLFAWKNYSLKKQLADKYKGTELAQTDRNDLK